MSKAMQRELRINQAIDEHLNGILKEMEELLKKSTIWESKMEVSQIQNLLTVAQETNSVEVIKNYIRYQIGRTAPPHPGGGASAGPSFGEQIIAELDRLRGIASGLTPQQDSSEIEIDRAWIKMTRLYLGYLRRYFYYKKRGA